MDAICLTLKQPYASLVMAGIKEVENRSWPTNHRGPLVIHAGKGIDRQDMARWGHLLPDVLPAGQILGTVQITDCQFDAYSDASEHAESGYFHWVLDDPQPLPEPIPMRGKLGLWKVAI